MIVPSDYQKLESLPEDPEGCVSYGKQTENALCMISIYPIESEEETREFLKRLGYNVK